MLTLSLWALAVGSRACPTNENIEPSRIDEGVGESLGIATGNGVGCFLPDDNSFEKAESHPFPTQTNYN